MVLYYLIGCVCVCSLAVRLRTSSARRVWECSSRPGLSSMWPQCTSSPRSAAAGRAIPPPTSSSTLEPRPTSGDTWGSWRASLSSSGSGSRWCWLSGCMTTEREASGQLSVVQRARCRHALKENCEHLFNILHCVPVRHNEGADRVPWKTNYLGVSRTLKLAFQLLFVYQKDCPVGIKNLIANILSSVD